LWPLLYGVIGHMLYGKLRKNRYLSFMVLSDTALPFYMYITKKHHIVKFSVLAMYVH